VKIKVTYEEADLKQLIRVDLARQGITATDADIVFAKTKAEVKAEVTVEVTRDDASLAEPEPPALTTEQRINHTHDVMTRPDMGRPPPAPPPAPPPPAPPLQVVEGGNNPVDMTDILGASTRIARNNPGKFPVPERQLMDGESLDFPGDKP
jgi:hypothetical protein